MQKKIVSATTQFNNIRIKLFTYLKAGNYKEILKIVTENIGIKDDLLLARGGATGKNSIFWLGYGFQNRLNQKTLAQKNNAKITLLNEMNNPESDLSKVLKAFVPISTNILAAATSHANDTVLGSKYLSDILQSTDLFNLCMNRMGVQIGNLSENDMITAPARQLPIWNVLPNKIKPSSRPDILVFGPGVLMDSSFAFKRKDGSIVTFACPEPFSPQFHELRWVLGSAKKITVIDASERVCQAIREQVTRQIPNYLPEFGPQRISISQNTPELIVRNEEIKWSKEYFSKFEANTQDLILATYVLCYPMQAYQGSERINGAHEVYRGLIKALKPGGVFFVDENSFAQSYNIGPLTIEDNWNQLMMNFKQTASVFPKKTLTLEHFEDERSKNNYFCITKI